MNRERSEKSKPFLWQALKETSSIVADSISAILIGKNPKLILKYQRLGKKLDRIAKGDITDHEEIRATLAETKKIEEQL